LQRNEAAVDTQLALLPVSEQKLPWTGPIRSPFYGVTNASLLHPTNGLLMARDWTALCTAIRARSGGKAQWRRRPNGSGAGANFRRAPGLATERPLFLGRLSSFAAGAGYAQRLWVLGGVDEKPETLYWPVIR